MHRALFVLLLIPLAGCLSGPTDPTLDPALTDAPVALAFSGRVAFGENTTGTAVDAPGTPGFTYVAGYGPEPTIGATSSGALFTAMFSTVLRSTDNGTTWEPVQQHSVPVAGDTAGDNNDPMLWVDPVTDRVYNAPMFPILLCSSIYWSDDDGASWTDPATPACGTGAFDHQKFATGLPGPDANPLAGALWPTVAYICYNGIAVTNCMASYDGGQTWPVDQPTAVNTAGLLLDAAGAPVPADQMTTCLAGQNGHPSAGPDGTVAFLRTWSCPEPVLTYSTDSGLTWNNVPGPGFPGGPSDLLAAANVHSIDPEVAWTPDGTLYAMFQGHDHHTYLARTSDLGATWQGPWDVTAPGVGSTVFMALATGSDGRVAMAYVGATGVTGSSAAVGPEPRWHLWMVSSEDADTDDPTFIAYQATPDEDPVQIGEIHQGGGTDGDRNLLDFIDGAVAPDGTFYVAFTDGCSTFNGCSDLPPEEQTAAYRGSAGAVAWLRGWSLYA